MSPRERTPDHAEITTAGGHSSRTFREARGSRARRDAAAEAWLSSCGALVKNGRRREAPAPIRPARRGTSCAEGIRATTRSDETVLVLRAPFGTLHAAIAIVREGADIPPAVFVLHASLDPGARTRPGAAVFLLSPVQIRDHAKRLSVEHHVTSAPRRSAELLSRLTQADQRIHDACAELLQASRLEQRTPPTAEWLLDNEYVIESNTRDVLVNLPPHFYRELPTLAPRPSDGSAANLRSCLRAHRRFGASPRQREYPLLHRRLPGRHPPCHRRAVGLAADAAHRAHRGYLRSGACASEELRERESADFWANRLIRANSWGSDQLFSLLAELSAVFPRPAPTSPRSLSPISTMTRRPSCTSRDGSSVHAICH